MFIVTGLPAGLLATIWKMRAVLFDGAVRSVPEPAPAILALAM
jgi:hypothetical protein